MGAICYFNALTQALLSCSSFNQAVLTEGDKFESSVGKAVYEMMTKLPNIGGSNNVNVMNTVFEKAKERKDLSALIGGNQCCLEAYILLIEYIDSKCIERLFKHRFNEIIHCLKCDKMTMVQKKCDNIIFDVPSNFKFDDTNPSLQDFIKQSLVTLVGNYKCTRCGSVDQKIKMEMLIMVPEIVVLVFQAGIPPNKLSIPEKFILPGEDDEKKDVPLEYNAVAQIEHSGTSTGGHYWAICKRNDGWYELNDSSVSESQFGVTTNTYMVFYHIKEPFGSF